VGLGETGQPPKAGQVVDPRADLWDKGQHSKLNCPTFLGEELIQTELKMKGNMADAWQKQQL
jgi:hypothetical protein